MVHVEHEHDRDVHERWLDTVDRGGRLRRRGLLQLACEQIGKTVTAQTALVLAPFVLLLDQADNLSFVDGVQQIFVVVLVHQLDVLVL